MSDKETSTSTSKPERKIIPRESPPVFPMALRVGISGDMCFLDLMDMPEKDVNKIFYTVALTKKHAQNLVVGLNRFIESGE